MKTVKVTVNGKEMEVSADSAMVKGFGNFDAVTKGAPRFNIAELDKILAGAKMMDVKSVGIVIVDLTFELAGVKEKAIIFTFDKGGSGVLLASYND